MTEFISQQEMRQRCRTPGAKSLTSTVSVPAAPAGSPSAPPAHPETSAASGCDFETHPAGNAKNADA